MAERYAEARRNFRLDVPDNYNFGYDAIDRWAANPDKLAMHWVGPGGAERRVTFAELRADANRLAAALRRLGVAPGERAVVVLPRIPEWQIAMIGLLRAGVVALPGTTQLQPKDLAYRIRESETSVIICDDTTAGRVDTVRRDLPTLKQLIVVGAKRDGWHTWDDLLAAEDGTLARVPTRADDPALIFFTSGTTGNAKMVLHNGRYPAAHVITGKYWLDLGPDDLHWNASDTGWAKAAWSSLFGPWNQGAALFIQQPAPGPFNAAELLDLLAKYPITSLCGAPTIYRMVVQEDLAQYTFPHLRRCVAAGEPLNPEVIEIWRRHTGLTPADGYGQTETVLAVGNFPGEAIRPGSMGKPAPGYDLAILDDDLQPVAAGVEGNVAIRVKPARPAGLLVEYWKAPDTNARSFRGDWYLTGDRASCDEDGYFWFVGRADDVILSAGYRIGPFEVESALIEHPAVAEAAVVGAPDPIRGEVVKAYVVLARGYTPSNELAAELQDHVKYTTAPYKYPRQIEFTTELPKTISGKIRRVELRARTQAMQPQ
ncbi:MAG: acyl-CoA synthetase [Thermomicrobiales bacterium]